MSSDLQQDLGFISHEAYFAALNHDGTVVASELHDPASKFVLVAEFSVSGHDMLAIYHHELDKWEVSHSDGTYSVPERDSQLWRFAELTVDANYDKLFAVDYDKILVRRMAKQIQAEIDCEIIKGLSMSANTPEVQLTIPALPSTPRKLKASWSVDYSDNFRSTMSRRLVGRSQLGVSQ